ncbi:hypothetical protein PHISP_07834 [Aspergillus sp. HF37]|nr:hypothetical protein PHISP_07834 [Aspergillus sp. HF37]
MAMTPRSLLSLRSSRLLRPRLLSARVASPSPSILPATISSAPKHRAPIPLHIQPIQSRQYSASASTGKSEPDQLVDELQELYEIATDEFEIATDSTDSATIYAASDRESARDALNQLLAVYTLYTTDAASAEFQSVLREQEERRQIEGQEEDEGDAESQVVTTNFDPAQVTAPAREEVRKRVGQRVRELRNAVETLEERAMAD